MERLLVVRDYRVGEHPRSASTRNQLPCPVSQCTRPAHAFDWFDKTMLPFLQDLCDLAAAKGATTTTVHVLGEPAAAHGRLDTAMSTKLRPRRTLILQN